MKRVVQRRPSASMIVSLVALVVAMSGTAVAASRLVSGDRLIRKGTLSGNRLRKHTLTGRQINLKKLGTVPSAAVAAHANTAVYAQKAVTAENAGNADALGGQPASSYLTSGSRIGTPGIVKVSGTPSGTTVTLLNRGPFTMTMTCTTSGANNSDTALTLQGSSSEANSDVNGVLNPTPNTTVTFPSPPSIRATALATSSDDYVFAFEAPSGAQTVLTGSVGVNSLGVSNGCWANLVGIA
jgi:hypothetical protein